ncbi:MAG TPA: hypothetical protein VGU20_30505 [Stellaceae bacterium]|nr:hypothetical protein [Stellaceae bacterium]
MLLLALVGPGLLHIAISGGPMTSAGEVWGWVGTGLMAASGLLHAFIYAGLLAVFGASLRAGREPLVTALSRRMSGAVSAERAAYTRGVTWAWCAFFAGQIVTSLALFLLAPRPVWLFFVNLLNVPLLALMFIAEHTVRPFLLKNAPRYSVADVRRFIAYIKEGLAGARNG